MARKCSHARVRVVVVHRFGPHRQEQSPMFVCVACGCYRLRPRNYPQGQWWPCVRDTSVDAIPADLREGIALEFGPVVPWEAAEAALERAYEAHVSRHPRLAIGAGLAEYREVETPEGMVTEWRPKLAPMTIDAGLW